MSLRPLALTDMQLTILQRAAGSLPIEQRDRFLQQVAAQLRGQPATHAVEVAVGRALATNYFCDGIK